MALRNSVLDCLCTVATIDAANDGYRIPLQCKVIRVYQVLLPKGIRVPSSHRTGTLMALMPTVSMWFRL